jgi:hypothetical protein
VDFSNPASITAELPQASTLIQHWPS